MQKLFRINAKANSVNAKAISKFKLSTLYTKLTSF